MNPLLPANGQNRTVTDVGVGGAQRGHMTSGAGQVWSFAIGRFGGVQFPTTRRAQLF